MGEKIGTMDREILGRLENKKLGSFGFVVASVFIIFVDISGCQDFRIDNQLRIQMNDCYTRIAIGSRMPDSAVISTSAGSSLSDCEASCSGNRTICNAFSFGIDARGNGTCRIGRININARGNDLIADSDWDVYERRAKMPRGCQHDRLLRIGFGARQSIVNSSATGNATAIGRQSNSQANVSSTMTTNGAATRRPSNPFGNPFAGERTLVDGSPREASFFRGGWYSPLADDGDSRLYDIINNKKTSRSNRWKQTDHRGHHFPGGRHTEDHRSGTKYEVGLQGVHDYGGYFGGGVPLGGFGGEEEWNLGSRGLNGKLEGSDPGLGAKWIEGGAGFNPEWGQHGPGLDAKWIQTVPGSDGKWIEDVSGLDHKWNEEGSGLSTKWSQDGRNSNPKWTGGVPGLNSKWNQDVPRSRTKWIEAIPGSSSKWNQGVSDLNPKWTETIRGSNPTLNEGSEDIGSKWNVGFVKLDGPQPEIDRFPSTIAPEASTPGRFPKIAGHGLPALTNSDPVLEKTKSCYRKLLAGKRVADGHVRRNVQCSRIEDCHRVCEYESTFVCEGFNYGRMQTGVSLGRHDERMHMCQLTSLSPTAMDVRRDFVQDPSYDYYERDWRCPASRPSQQDGRWSNDPRRPVWNVSPTSTPSRRPSNEIPERPRRPNHRYPIVATSGNDGSYWIPQNGGSTTKIRENDYDYYSGRQRPRDDVVRYRQPPSDPRRPSYLPNPDYYAFPETDPSRFGIYPKYPDRRHDENVWQRPRHRFRPNDLQPDRGHRRPVGHYLPPKDWPDSGIYGSSYGYESNRYDGRIPGGTYDRSPANFYDDNDVNVPPEPRRRRPQMQEGHRYGPAYGYDDRGQHVQRIDSYLPVRKPHRGSQPSPGPASASGGSRDCSVRSATGFNIDRKIVDASYATGNLAECEMLCAGRKDCQTFAYRYSLAADAPTNNCLLSTVNFSKLNFYTELIPDRDWDIYAMVGDSRDCQASKQGGSAEPQSHQRPSEECFWRMRSGFGMPESMMRKEIRVDNGLGECQIACVSARQFTCRSFVFRYESDRDRGPNCFLSDCPSSEIISGDGARLPRVDQAELYERGSYGRGCELYPFATIYNPDNFDKPKAWTGSSNHVGNHRDEGCYSGYDGGCRLSPYAVSSMTRVNTETECRRKCSRMRNHPQSPCMSFSFKIGDEKEGDNCYLSDVPRKDLRPGLDYVYDDDYVMYAWKELEPQCSLFPMGSANDGSFNGYHYDVPGVSLGHWPGDGSNVGKPPPLGPGTGIFTYNHLVLGVRPLESDKPGPLNPPGYPSHPAAPPGGDDHYPGFGPFNPDGLASFNRHYTVNGMPCKRGTKCERNQLVGFWSCEPEGSETGSWDYCCEPNHHCGFSQGHRYPWCYVGPSEDQWRPCSDEYFPYLPSPRPALRPNPPDHDHPPYHHSVQTVDDYDSTTHNSRHWPIAFLHPCPPPNATDNVAVADDRRDDSHRRINATIERTFDNVTQTTKTNATMNSPITHLQLHNSHLKRRGLSTTNVSRTFSTERRKKIRRITIIPANQSDDRVAPRPPSYGARYATEKPLEFVESGYKDNGTKISSGRDGFEVIRLEASLGNVEAAENGKRILGRIERVRKPGWTSTVGPENREDKDETRGRILSTEIDGISRYTDAERSNNSIRASRRV